MPHVAVLMYPGRDDETKKALAEKIKVAVMEECKVGEQAVTISVIDIPKEDFPNAVKDIPPECIVIDPKK